MARAVAAARYHLAIKRTTLEQNRRQWKIFHIVIIFQVVRLQQILNYYFQQI